MQTENAHAKFSASSAYRWIPCPASIKLSEKAPPQPENRYATEGTNAHKVLEALIKTWNENQITTPIEKVYRKKFGDEMVDHCVSAMEEIDRRATNGSIVLSETKSKLDFIHDDMGGTCDCAIIEPFGDLTVIDFKYGVNPVDPEENPQLISYALGIAHQYNYDFRRVKLVIIQPRSMDADEKGIVKEWVTTIANLTEWANVFNRAKDNALGPNPTLKANDTVKGEDYCRYCPAAVICPELKDKSLAEVQADFDDETGAIALPMLTEKPILKNLGPILNACDKLEMWIGKVRELAFSQLEGGGVVRGWKLVQKRSIRKWVDPEHVSDEARVFYGNNAFTKPGLLSPAQFEKKCGPTPDWIAARTTSQSSGLTIAPESDKRPAFSFFEAEFKELGAEEGESELATKTKTKKKTTKTKSKTKR